jgi:hypothetical protein
MLVGKKQPVLLSSIEAFGSWAILFFGILNPFHANAAFTPSQGSRGRTVFA